MTDTTPTLYTVIRAVGEQLLRGVNVAIPGRVEAYDATTQRATVQPMIKRAYIDATGARQVANRAPVPDVPIVFVGGGGSRLTFPTAIGDTVLLVFCHASLDAWLNSGKIVDPGDDRRHDPTDAVAIAGLFSFKGAEAAHASATVLYGDDVRLGGDAGGALATKADLQAVVDALVDSATGASDGGATYKANIVAALVGYPVGTTKVTAE